MIANPPPCLLPGLRLVKKENSETQLTKTESPLPPPLSPFPADTAAVHWIVISSHTRRPDPPVRTTPRLPPSSRLSEGPQPHS